MTDNFVCMKCGYSFPKKGANVSGYEGGANGLHVHCPKCGAVATQYVKLKEVTPTAGDGQAVGVRRKVGRLLV
jgi:rubredoxin